MQPLILPLELEFPLIFVLFSSFLVDLVVPVSKFFFFFLFLKFSLFSLFITFFLYVVNFALKFAMHLHFGTA